MSSIKDLWVPASAGSGAAIADSSGRFGAAPGIIVTSGIFSSQPQHVKRKLYVPPVGERYTAEHRIQGPKGFEIYQRTGWELRQAEGSIYYQLLLLCLAADKSALEQSALGEHLVIRFSRNDVLARVGWGVGGNQVDALWRGLNLLGDARFHVIKESGPNQFSWTANLLSLGKSDSPAATHYSVHVDAELARLFATGVTRLDLHQRAQLSDNLSRWLHGYYSSHEVPFPVRIASLKVWSGRQGQRDDKFKLALEKALDELLAVTGWSGEVRDGLVVVDRGLGQRKVARKAQEASRNLPLDFDDDI